MRGLLISIVLTAVLTSGPLIPAVRSQTEQNTFSPAQYDWAMGWINGPLETLMAHGVIESISSSETNFQIWTGNLWKQLSFRQAGEILSNFSRARQITGHSPFFTVDERNTGTALGRVTQASITVFIPGEGYFEYFPDTNTRENTAY